ncbi:hypothetical protein CLV58_101168 [Spirosoma oryzae]|uniref:Uncharacterized protein n=1 Tax=Spirosoma oryzae TaxID=1469603 RepID=A0A2T0TN13_9BACT|nr:hypothetical protein [Spirosoma oryzae]PRY47102.1 hypothetical protein CLV58_101168 [Spirosoma oryzae]
MPQIKGFNFDKMPSALMQVFDGRRDIITNALIDGEAALRQDFSLLVTDNKSPLVNLEVMDVLKSASDDFDPADNPLKFGARVPEFEDVDIDLHFTIGEIQTLYRSYLQFIAGLKTEKEVIANPFEVFFITQILKTARANLRTMSSWKAVKNASTRGSAYAITGLLAKMTAGRAVNGDIASTQVRAVTATIDGTNAYEEVIAMCKLVESVNEALLSQALQLRLSPGMARLVNERRIAKFPNVLKPGDVMTKVDGYESVTVTPDIGLVGKQTMAITPASNLFFVCNEDVSAYRLKVVDSVKGWDINIRMSVGFDYGYGKLLFLNDKV